LAAALLRKKLVLFEANCTLGKVNRWFAPFAKAIALQFPIAMKKAVYVPLLPWVGKKTERVDAEEARALYQLAPDRFTILVFGGSQGAAFLNQTFCQVAHLLQKKGMQIQVIHLTGKGDWDVRYECPAVVKPFETQMALAYSAADLVVCRCGAGTTAELIRFQKPAIVIPYPFAYDHQRKNGELIQKGARLLPQKEASPERLAKEIETIRSELPARAAAYLSIALPETVDFGSLVRKIGERG
jgi:UDP-N-acetylglucosamine--N-acetylmuramyl-(pentapeptide) pyrophosphoryl-undecaprenol N-acetylglucosamine transferase